MAIHQNNFASNRRTKKQLESLAGKDLPGARLYFTLLCCRLTVNGLNAKWLVTLADGTAWHLHYRLV